MAAFNKLMQKVLDKHKGLRFEDLEKVLTYIGYKMGKPRGGSSHRTFRKAGYPPVTIPDKSPINSVYVNIVRNVLVDFLAGEEE